jgi:serine/threonine protein kinase
MAKTPSKFPFSEVDDFQLQELIYEGPHTLVFRGHQSNLNRAVLIKLLKPSIKERKEWIERFQREARVCAQFKHPNIVSVYKLGEKNSYHYIALEFIEGVSLKELLSNTTPLPLQISLSITGQILEALIYVHQNKIIHRDIKPGNILIDRHGRAKLTDFGLAHIGDEVSVTLQGSIIGTPAYMAPEQIVGNALDGRTDLFSLGAVIYEMLTGKQAFGGESYSACLHKIINEQPPPPSQLNSRLPKDMNSFVGRFLGKTPDERWKDSQQAHEYLQRLAGQNKIKLDRISVQNFISSFSKTASSDKKQAPYTEEAIKNKFIKRWKLISGFAAIIILLLISFFWMGQQKKPSPKFADQQQNLISAESDSEKIGFQPKLHSDSDTFAKNVTETATKGKESPTSLAAQGLNPPPQKPGDIAVDTLLAERTPDKSPNAEEHTTVEKNTMAQLNVSVDPWAKIMIDDQEIESQANQISVPISPGKHTLTFLHPNFSPYAMPLQIQPGEEKTVKWSFLKNAGFLSIEVRPWAEIYIDNQFRDSTPLENPITLSSGKHFLELKHPQLASYRDYITIEPRDTLRLQIVLKE